MPPSLKSSKQSHIGKEGDNSVIPSNNLWVGNLTFEVTESDLMDLFAKYGALDSIATYSSRAYAFVFFKRVEDAKLAKDALQGSVLRGSAVKIEFARPAKPSKSLWVGGISASVSKEKLGEEFFKFGKVENFRFFRDRNTAFVDYFRLEDATQAMKNMNGKRIGGDQIRVDFLRSLPSRREHWPDSHDARDGQFFSRSMGPPDSPWMPQEASRNYSELSHSGPKRHQPSQSSGGQKVEGQASNILWIGYPPSVQMDEQMLHNAMILFGEIERIKSFPSRNYSFVEFRSVDEARRAKEGLQGRLFNDPRISIMFSSSEFAPGKDYPAFYPGIKGPRPDMFVGELPFRPAQIDLFSHNRPMVSNSFSGPLPPTGIVGPNLLRPFGRQVGFDTLISGPEFSDVASRPSLQDANPNSLMVPNWRRLSPPAAGILPSPSPGVRPSSRSTSGAWDVLDVHQFRRESKRSRVDGALSIDDASYPLKKMDDRGLGLDQQFVLGPQLDAGPSGLPENVQGKNRFSQIDALITMGAPIQGRPSNDYVWRGVIAKGGTPVCRARCVPIGKGIESELSEVVNCSARTGLDMLAKHYAEAIGFDIVFFLPDSEEDFASYTEFLRYLGAKDRAGVAKLDDGTTLFLVPPSDFLTKVLSVSGPERLYGVVLKLPQVPSSASVQHHLQNSITSSQYVGRQQIPPQSEYGLVHQEEQVLQLDCNKVLPPEPKIPPKPLLQPTNETSMLQSGSHDYPLVNTATLSQSGVSLTPELIATLASLLPTNTQPSESGHPMSGSSITRSSFPPPVAHDKGILLQGWKQDHQASEQSGHPSQQLVNQFNPQPQLPRQFQSYPTVSNVPSHSTQVVLGSTQMQDSALNMPQQGTISSRPLLNFSISPQNGQFAVADQQYQLEVPNNTQKGYGLAVGADASGSYGSPIFQQPKNPVTLANAVHGGNVYQPQNVMSMAVDRSNSEPLNQVQQPQSVPYGADHGAAEVEADKNQRYQSTLQFAANLLLQLQQQQANTQAGQGSGSQQ